jgi:hypothetical protein
LLLAGLCFTSAVLFLVRRDVQGCTCIGKPPVSESFAEARAVFVGVVIEKRPSTWELFEGQSSAGFVYEFRVERAWKGISEPRVQVLTGIGRGDCGWPFELGRTYLVYVYGRGEMMDHLAAATGTYSSVAEGGRGDEALTTHICTRTSRIEQAGEDLVALGVPRIAFVMTRESPWTVSLICGGLSLVAAMVGIVIGRRWERSARETTFEFDEVAEEP